MGQPSTAQDVAGLACAFPTSWGRAEGGWAFIAPDPTSPFHQPDINVPICATITETDGEEGTITVEGDYLSLGVSGTRFRIFAPPGTETRGPLAGTLQDMWVSALSSRCLYGGYRTESPLAGRVQYGQPNPPSQTEAAFSDASAAYTLAFNTWRTSNTFGAAPVPPDVNDYVIRRQGKLNFTGLQYTLHRHYDPFLMRFTSPDPISSPFWNRNAYCFNNPNSFRDPDGLEGEISFSFDGYWRRLTNIVTKGKFEFGLETGGYGQRLDATTEGAMVQTFDVLTLGQVVTDNERAAMAHKWGSQGLGGYYDAGGAVGSTTALTALSIATAGTFSGVGMAGNVGRVGLGAWMGGGAVAGGYGGAADAGIAGGGAGDMLAGAAVGAVIGAGTEVLGAVGARAVSSLVRGTARTISTLRLPKMTYHLSEMPHIAENIASAQRAGRPSVLTRTTDPSQIARNRRLAIGNLTAESPTMSLDEYPFASSMEGGVGAQVRSVPRSEQNRQGALIKNFYDKHKIKHGDRYRVKVKR